MNPNATQTPNWFRLQIIVAVYNNVDHISECVDSILAQNVDFSIQVVFADGGSTDGSLLVISQYIKQHPTICRQISYEGKKSLENALNASLNSLNCTYLTLADAKDRWIDLEKAAKQVKFLEDHNLYSACGHQVKQQQSIIKSQTIGQSNDQHIYTTEMIVNFEGFPNESLMYRVSSFEKLDLWQPLLSASTMILAHLSSFKAPIYIIPEVLSTRYSPKVNKRSFEKKIKWLTVRILACKRLNVESRLKHDELFDKEIRSYHRDRFKLGLRFKNKWVKEDFKEGVKKLNQGQKIKFVIKSLWEWMLT